MKKISLTHGKFAIIDDADYEEISKYKWHFQNGYARRKELGKSRMIYMHRQILDAPLGLEVDHINHKKADNRRENIRLCTRSQNHMNRLPKKGTSSKYKGLTWTKNCKRWCVQITKDYKKMVIGYYKSEKVAAISYNKKAKELFGDYCFLNIITK